MKAPFAAVLLLCLLIFASCSAPKRGCADIRAINFSFDADEPCMGTATSADCPCIYPKLGLQPLSRYVQNTTGSDSIVNWSAGSPILNKAGQLYFLKRYAFYISNISLTDYVGSVFNLQDSISIPFRKSAADSGFVTISSNPVLIGEKSSAVMAGTFLNSGKFRQLNFTFGLRSPEKHANISSIKMPIHPLNTDSMYLKNEYKLVGGKFFYQTLDGKSGVVLVNESRDISIPLQPDLYFTPAADIVLKLGIDFRKFFENVDFSKHSASEIEVKILENMGEVFSVSK